MTENHTSYDRHLVSIWKKWIFRSTTVIIHGRVFLTSFLFFFFVTFSFAEQTLSTWKSFLVAYRSWRSRTFKHCNSDSDFTPFIIITIPSTRENPTDTSLYIYIFVYVCIALTEFEGRSPSSSRFRRTAHLYRNAAWRPGPRTGRALARVRGHVSFRRRFGNSFRVDSPAKRDDRSGKTAGVIRSCKPARVFPVRSRERIYTIPAIPVTTCRHPPPPGRLGLSAARRPARTTAFPIQNRSLSRLSRPHRNTHYSSLCSNAGPASEERCFFTPTTRSIPI